MDNPLISIVIPLFNRFEHVHRAINSVISQSYTNWELFIVDDCSKDEFKLGSQLNLSQFKIQLIRNQKNLGPGLSRQVGLNLSNGYYISFLDSDDYWKPDFLQKSLEVHLASPELCATYTQSEMIDGTLRRRNMSHEAVDDIFYGVVSGVRPWATCSILWKKKFLGSWRSIRTNQDALFELETSVKNSKIQMIPEILCVIDKNTGSNAEDLVGKKKGNINRAKVLLIAVQLLHEYNGEYKEINKSALWLSLYEQSKKLVKQGEYRLSIRILILLMRYLTWR